LKIFSPPISKQVEFDVDDDGTVESTLDVPAGETKSASLSELTTATDTLGISVNTTFASADLSFTEVTTTQEPAVELNGQSVSHSGTLADGETVTKTINKSALQSGTNTVNVSVGDGSLSADAPPAQVGINYSHDASDNIATEYDATQFRERYNVTKTFSSNRTNATLTVPFQTDVIAVESAETSVNGGAWTAADHSLDGTTLTVDVGNVSAGDEVRVRANGSAIDPLDGSVTVVEPTPPDQPLNSTVEIDSTDGELRIATVNGQFHYVAAQGANGSSTSYTPDSWMVYDQQSPAHRIHLANATAGDWATIRRLPYRAEAVQRDGVRIDVGQSPDESELAMDVEPIGLVSDVEFTYLDATDGTEYVLYSESAGIVRDSGTATSPLTLKDDSSQETLVFMVEGSASGGDDGGGGAVGMIADTGSGSAALLPVDIAPWLSIPTLTLGLALAALVVVARNDDRVADAGSGAAATLDSVADRVPVLGPAVGNVLAGVVRSASQFVTALVTNRTVAYGIGVALALGGIQAGLIPLPEELFIIVTVGVVAFGSLIGLREYDEFSLERWAVIVVGTTIVALQTLADAPLLTAIVESQVWPILAVGALFLVYQFVQSLQGPDEVNEIVIRGDAEDPDQEDE
jgi:hypothetical protein